jgi:hypothetical protein
LEKNVGRDPTPTRGLYRTVALATSRKSALTAPTPNHHDTGMNAPSAPAPTISLSVQGRVIRAFGDEAIIHLDAGQTGGNSRRRFSK